MRTAPHILRLQPNRRGNDYFVGDVHGSHELLEMILRRMKEHDRLFCVGDLFDRGRDSWRVWDLITEARKKNEIHITFGNHEELFLKTFGYLKKLQEGIDPTPSEWMRLGFYFFCSWGNWILGINPNDTEVLNHQTNPSDFECFVRSKVAGFKNWNRLDAMADAISQFPYLIEIRPSSAEANNPVYVVHADLPEDVSSLQYKPDDWFDDEQLRYMTWARQMPADPNTPKIKQHQWPQNSSCLVVTGHSVVPPDGSTLREDKRVVNLDLGACFEDQMPYLCRGPNAKFKIALARSTATVPERLFLKQLREINLMLSQRGLGVNPAKFNPREFEEKTLDEIRELVASDDLEAIHYLASCFKNGSRVQKNDAEAFKLYEQAARLDDPAGFYELGSAYENGRGVAQNIDKAACCYFDAAKKNPRNDKSARSAFRSLDQLAKKYPGSSVAQNNLGACHESGYGTSLNPQEAARLYKIAADLDNPVAMCNLAYLYKFGEGVELNNERAIEWSYKALIKNPRHPKFALELLEELAKENNPRAICALADYYSDIENNPTHAVPLYENAAELGDYNALCKLGLAYQNGHGVEKNIHRAIDYYFEAAKLQKNPENADSNNSAFALLNALLDLQPDPYLLTNLGNCYGNGYGVEKNEAEALALYQRAAQSGDYYAIGNLGRAYEHGLGVETNIAAAAKWYFEAAKNNPNNAKQRQLALASLTRLSKLDHPETAAVLNKLGLCYEYGYDTVKAEKISTSLYQKAAELGDYNAMRNLGSAYEHGRGIKKDIYAAALWYAKAAKIELENPSLGSQASNSFRQLTSSKTSKALDFAIQQNNQAAIQVLALQLLAVYKAQLTQRTQDYYPRFALFGLCCFKGFSKQDKLDAVAALEASIGEGDKTQLDRNKAALYNGRLYQQVTRHLIQEEGLKIALGL